LANTATVTVRLDYSTAEVIADCVFRLDAPDFRFSLSDAMTVTAASCAMTPMRTWKPRWGRQSVEYSAEATVEPLAFSYRGKPKGWCNAIQKNRTALSSYSSWFPFELSQPVDISYELPDMQDYTTVNGRYSAAEKLWRYGGGGYEDGNVIALRNGKFHTVARGGFTFFYRRKRDRALAVCYAENFAKIAGYYRAVFPPKELKAMSAVLLGLRTGGAYYRKGLLVLGKASELGRKSRRESGVVRLLGHELGHNWFTGADTSSWHDWLNETGAEWAALLYAAQNLGAACFESQFAQSARYFKNYKVTPPIKPVNGDARPDQGVHSRGVALFGEIYRKHGADTILRLLCILAALERVTTENYLAALRSDGFGDIAGYIERSLTEAEYPAL